MTTAGAWSLGDGKASAVASEIEFSVDTLASLVVDVGLKDYGSGGPIHQPMTLTGDAPPAGTLGAALLACVKHVRDDNADRALDAVHVQAINDALSAAGLTANHPHYKRIGAPDTPPAPGPTIRPFTLTDLTDARTFDTDNPVLPDGMLSYWGSRRQLAYGQVVSRILLPNRWLHPLTAILRNPTGGIVGPGARDVTGAVQVAKLWTTDLGFALAYHAIVHDATGYLFNYENAFGRGYTYTDPVRENEWRWMYWATRANPLAGQRSGLDRWDRVWDQLQLRVGAGAGPAPDDGVLKALAVPVVDAFALAVVGPVVESVAAAGVDAAARAHARALFNAALAAAIAERGGDIKTAATDVDKQANAADANDPAAVADRAAFAAMERAPNTRDAMERARKEFEQQDTKQPAAGGSGGGGGGSGGGGGRAAFCAAHHKHLHHACERRRAMAWRQQCAAALVALGGLVFFALRGGRKP